LVSGRIGGVYGHKNVLFMGGAWWILWSLINGFCTGDIIAFAIARALSGIGAAFVGSIVQNLLEDEANNYRCQTLSLSLDSLFY